MQKLDNTVIKVLDREHGKKVIEWWKSQGVGTNGCEGICTLNDGRSHIYYGVINGYFGNYSLKDVKNHDAKIIELPQEKDYSVKGTPLPVIPEGTEYRCIHWDFSDPNSTTFVERSNMVSYGIVEYEGIQYVVYEEINYDNRFCDMTPLSIIRELDKKEQSKSEPMKTRTITSEQAQSIIDVACETWKNTLFDKWGKAIVLKKEITIDESFYQEMRKACTTPQNELFDKIFGKDFKNPYKVGDFLFVVHGGWNCTTHKAYKKSLCNGDVDEIIEFDFYENNVMALTKTGAVLRIETNPSAFRLAQKHEIYKKGDWVYVGRETSVWDSVVQLLDVGEKLSSALNKRGEHGEFNTLYLERLATEEEIKEIKSKTFIPKGTPCLVRDNDRFNWILVYSNGDGTFTGTDSTRSCIKWIYVQVLDINNLPTE